MVGNGLAEGVKGVADGVTVGSMRIYWMVPEGVAVRVADG